MLAKLGFEDTNGCYEVYSNHEAKDWQDVEVKVGSQQSQYEPSTDDVNKVEQKLLGPLPVQ